MPTHQRKNFTFRTEYRKIQTRNNSVFGNFSRSAVFLNFLNADINSSASLYLSHYTFHFENLCGNLYHLSQQENFTLQEIWRTSLPFSELFFVNVSFGINKNILHLTFPRAEFWSFRIKCKSLQEYLMTKINDYIWNIMSKRHDILPTRTSFFISSAGKIENVEEFKIIFFEKLFHCRWQPCKNCMGTCSSFQWTYFTILR